MSSTSLWFDFVKRKNNVSSEMGSIGNSAAKMASKIKASSVISVAATGAMYTGYATLAAEAAALVVAATPVAGALALLPAAGLAAVGVFGALKLTMSGLGAALKNTAGAAGSTADAVAAATQRVATAQQGATQAQKDLTAARQAEVLADRDLALSLKEANESVLESTYAVTQAERDLRAARQSGNRDQIIQAEFALTDAQNATEQAQNHATDTQAELNKRQQQGVGNSDQVQQALQRQTQATQELTNAQKALTQAQAGGGAASAAAQAYAKLSPAGKSLVNVLHSLTPAWQAVTRATQQAGLAGLGGDVQRLANAYLPHLGSELGGIAAGWNTAFDQTAKLATTKGFVTDINTTLNNTATFWQRAGKAAAPFFDAFRQFAVVASSFLPGFGSDVASIATRFDAWATAARTTGKAHEWIERALTVMGELWQVTKNLGASVVEIFRAGSGGPAWLPGLVSGTKALSDWLASPAGQGKLSKVFSDLRDIGSQVLGAMQKLGPTVLDIANNGGPLLTKAIGDLNDVVHWLNDHVGLVTAGIVAFGLATVGAKAAASAALPIELIRLGISAAQLASSIATTAAIRANTAALRGQTVATEEAAVAQEELDVAMDANPIGAIVIGILALIAVIIVVIKYHKQIAEAAKVAWHAVQTAAGVAADWVSDKWNKFIGFAKGIPKAISSAFDAAWGSVKSGFVSVLNWLIDKLNSFIHGANGDLDILNKLPGVNIKHIPDIPHLATGGRATDGGLALVGEHGAEVVKLGAGDTVYPHGTGPSRGGVQEVRLVIDVTGADEDMKRLIRRIVKTTSGGGSNSVQVTFG